MKASPKNEQKTAKLNKINKIKYIYNISVCVGDPRELSKSDNDKCTAHFDVEQVALAPYEQYQENDRKRGRERKEKTKLD